MPPIQPPLFDPLVAAGIALLAVVVSVAGAALFAAGGEAVRGRRRMILLGGALAVMAATAVAANAGLLVRFDMRPPPMVAVLALGLGLALAFGLSRWGRDAAASVSMAALVGLHAFRLPLELVMHRAARLGVMPHAMSFDVGAGGVNLDILTGASALVLAVLLARGARVPRSVLWTFNVGGMALLATIVGVSVAASPLVRAFGDDPAALNTWVLFAPYVWLPAVLVPIALAGHVVLTRRLLRPSPESA